MKAREYEEGELKIDSKFDQKVRFSPVTVNDERRTTPES